MSEEEKAQSNSDNSPASHSTQAGRSALAKQAENQVSVNANQVIAFLKQNPNFFKTNPRLIADLNFVHETGGAVSLIQRQVELLREHHQTTRKRLAELSNYAKTNEALLDRIRALSVTMASASTPKAILESLTKVIRHDFNLDSVYLVVEHKNWPMSNENVIGLTPEDLGKLRNAVYNLSVFVGRPPAKIKEMVLQDKMDKAASIAMARFKYKDVDTYLIIGSSDQNHFTSDMGTDFVAYIGDYLQALLSR